MLILSRKKNETIQIGDEIAVTIIRVSKNNVRIGIVAPQGTRVLRVELDAVTEACCHGQRSKKAA